MEHYRIGEFARELGVTPDFLKYCEKQGILRPHVEKNGYRYYEFAESAVTLEYLKMKNQGFSAKQIRESLHDASFDACLDKMRDRSTTLRRTIRFHQALLEYYQALEDIRDHFGARTTWYVRPVQGFYFLPHAVERRFIASDGIRERVSRWNPYLPIVMSTYRIVRDVKEEGIGGNVWGLSVEEGFARAQELPVDGPVAYVPPQRCLEIYIRREIPGAKPEYLQIADQLLRGNSLTACGDIYLKVIFKIVEEDGVRRMYSVMYVPVQD